MQIAIVGLGRKGGNFARRLMKYGHGVVVYDAMLPAGNITQDTIRELATLLQKDDTIIDGGNTFHRADLGRARTLAKRGVHYNIDDSGEGRWRIEEAVPANVLSVALCARFRSRVEHGVADKMLSAMRHGFWGHVEPGSDQ